VAWAHDYERVVAEAMAVENGATETMGLREQLRFYYALDTPAGAHQEL
jgi:hypothetical protein